MLEKGEIVEVVVNNLDSGRHPFHLHGHAFQAVWRSEEEAGTFQDSNVTSAQFPAIPMRRDTVVLFPEGNIVLRFRADNPGMFSLSISLSLSLSVSLHCAARSRPLFLCASFFFLLYFSHSPLITMSLRVLLAIVDKRSCIIIGVWFFHCHLEWHVQSGLVATFVEAPLELQKSLTIPENHLEACKAGGVPTIGNAAGNSQNLLDLSGQNAPPAPLPDGLAKYSPSTVVDSLSPCLLPLHPRYFPSIPPIFSTFERYP